MAASVSMAVFTASLGPWAATTQMQPFVGGDAKRQQDEVPCFGTAQSSDEPSEQADALSTTFTEFDLMAGQTAQSGQSFPG
jgi:hypothetical protein